MAKDQNVSITMRVRIGENELEVTGPSNYVDKKIEEFLKLQKSIHPASAIPSLSSEPSQSLPVSRKKMSISQFIRKVAPKNNVDRVLASGYFLEKFNNLESFTAAEVTQIIRDSKNIPPKNPSDSINNNIKKGFLMPAGDKDGKMSFVLTSDGEDIIDELLTPKRLN